MIVGKQSAAAKSVIVCMRYSWIHFYLHLKVFVMMIIRVLYRLTYSWTLCLGNSSSVTLEFKDLSTTTKESRIASLASPAGPGQRHGQNWTFTTISMPKKQTGDTHFTLSNKIFQTQWNIFQGFQRPPRPWICIFKIRGLSRTSGPWVPCIEVQTSIQLFYL